MAFKKKKKAAAEGENVAPVTAVGTTALNWVYGCKPPREGLGFIRTALRRANRYYNIHIAIERRRRAHFDEFVRKTFPELEQLSTEVAKLVADIGRLRQEMRDANAKARKRVNDADRSGQIKALRTALKEKSKAYKQARTAAYESEGFKDCVAHIEKDAHAYRLWARAACGLYWGTYNQVERSVEQAIADARPGLPNFRRFTGSGAVSFQAQKGLTPADVESDACTLVQIRQLQSPRGDGCRIGELWFRIGSLEKGKPHWAKLRIFMHRPFPAGCKIKFGHLQVKRRGKHEHWEVRFAITRAEGFGKPDCAATGRVGVDIGWRRVPNGLRVAYWVGDDGAEGEEILDAAEIEQIQFCRKLQSRQDVNRDGIKAKLVEWLASLDNEARLRLDWLVERLAYVDKWRSSSRLHSVLFEWRRRIQLAGGTVEPPAAARMLDSLRKWAWWDLRLHDERVNARKKLELRRRHQYRNFAARLRRQYHTIVVKDWDIAKFRKNPEVEEQPMAGGTKEHADLAAVGELRQYLVGMAAKVEKPSAAMTTLTCADCGALAQAPERAKLIHTCSSCGATYDQDRNAAIWLLRGGVPQLEGAGTN